MLDAMQGGIFHFQIAGIYRNSYLISNILSSSEVWYGLTQSEYEQLESVDKMWIKNLFNCSSCVPTELLYLELGLWPIRHIIMKRRCLYLHHILQQDENSLLFRFFLSRYRSPDLCFKNSQGQPQQDKAAVTTPFVPNCRYPTM